MISKTGIDISIGRYLVLPFIKNKILSRVRDSLYNTYMGGVCELHVYSELYALIYMMRSCYCISKNCGNSRSQRL